MESVTFYPYNPDQLREIMAQAAKMGAAEALKDLKGKKEDDEWVDMQEAMKIVGLKSPEGFATYRRKNRTKSKLIGRKKFFKKADLIK